MAMLLLVGSSEPVLEGVAQTLAAAGHRAIVAATAREAVEVASRAAPLMIVVERSVAESATLLAARLAPGGALVLFQAADDVAATVSPALRRLTLAELVLPLERQRLVALVRHVDQRARSVGRSAGDGATEAEA